MSGHAGTEFRFLTYEEKQTSTSIDPTAEVAVAIDPGNNVVSFFYFHGLRGTPCLECVKTCLTTMMLWTIPNRRDEGIFKALYVWVMEQKQPNKMYEASLAPAGDRETIRWKYGITPPLRGTTDISYEDAEARAVEFYDLVQAAVNN